MDQKDKDDFDIFLSKVKAVGSIINDISSADIETSKRGIEEADKYLCKEKDTSTVDDDGNVIAYSKCSLNRKALDETPQALDFSHMSADEFVAAVEKDVKERHEKKNSSK